MRELKRSIARHLMEMSGCEHINRPMYERPTKQRFHDGPAQNSGKKVSYFSMHWRDYLNPESKERKALHKAILRREALIYNRTGRKVTTHAWPLR